MNHSKQLIPTFSFAPIKMMRYVFELSFCLLIGYSVPTAAPKKKKGIKQETENVEVHEGLDTLPNLAITEEGEILSTSSQTTPKHPCHRPGCSCIVCIQPPSGKEPKHKQSCMCPVCSTVKRRFSTLMKQREHKLLEKELDNEKTNPKQQQPSLLNEEEAPHQHNSTGDIETTALSCSNNTISKEISFKQHQPQLLPLEEETTFQNSNITTISSPTRKKLNDGSNDDSNKIKTSTSPFKGQIDLNIQPEREEEVSDSDGVTKLLQDSTKTYLHQQGMPNSDSNTGMTVHEVEPEKERHSNGVTVGVVHPETDKSKGLYMKTSASTSATG